MNEQKKQWGVYVYDKEIHVVPEWEKPKHDRAHTCDCMPHKEVTNNILLVRHNAFDGTHLIEGGLNLINGEKP